MATDELPPVPATGLYPKLNAAILQVERLFKDSENTHFKFKFVSADEVYRAVRGPLLDQGLVVIPSIDDVASAGGSTTVRMALTIIDSESGERHEAHWVGEGQDNADKGPAKAVTGAMKTWLRHLFLLPSDEDDPDVGDAGVGTGAAPSRATPKQIGTIEGLAATAGFVGDGLEELMEWVKGRLTGGKEGSAQRLIDGLTNDDATIRGEIAEQAKGAAADWKKTIAETKEGIEDMAATIKSANKGTSK